MMKMLYLAIAATLLFVPATEAQEKVIKKYIVENDARLLKNTIGKPIAALAKGTECKVLREQGEMVQVQITGWVVRSMLQDTPPLRALHIMVDTRETAEQIIAQLRTGTSFEELARAKSVSSTAARGGDLGYFKKGDFDIKIETAITTLEINESSAIIEFGGKYNIFKRIE